MKPPQLQPPRDSLTFVSRIEYFGRASPFPIAEKNIVMIGAEHPKYTVPTNTFSPII